MWEAPIRKPDTNPIAKFWLSLIISTKKLRSRSELAEKSKKSLLFSWIDNDNRMPALKMHSAFDIRAVVIELTTFPNFVKIVVIVIFLDAEIFCSFVHEEWKSSMTNAYFSVYFAQSNFSNIDFYASLLTNRNAPHQNAIRRLYVEKLECKSRNIEFYRFDCYFHLLIFWECMKENFKIDFNEFWILNGAK